MYFWFNLVIFDVFPIWTETKARNLPERRNSGHFMDNLIYTVNSQASLAILCPKYREFSRWVRKTCGFKGPRDRKVESSLWSTLGSFAFLELRLSIWEELHWAGQFITLATFFNHPLPSSSLSAMPRSMLLRSSRRSLCSFSFSISNSDTLQIENVN